MSDIDKELEQLYNELPDPKEINKILKTTQPAALNRDREGWTRQTASDLELCTRAINFAVKSGWGGAGCLLRDRDLIHKLSQKYRVEMPGDNVPQRSHHIIFNAEPGYYEKNWLGNFIKKEL